MHRVQAIQVKDIVLDPPLSATIQHVAGQLAPPSRKAYTVNVKHFAGCMAERDLSFSLLSRDDLVVYRIHLAETYAKAVASRIWTIARRLLDEVARRDLLPKNPAEGICGLKAGDERPHRTLKQEEAKALLETIDRSTTLGKRDNALIMLLLRTGICRSEAVAPRLGDLMMEQGYHTAINRHGKGFKRGLAKLPVEVRQAIDDYLVTVGREYAAPEASLFVSFRKGNHLQEKPLHPN
jgi:site-specific recombinase XerD